MSRALCPECNGSELPSPCWKCRGTSLVDECGRVMEYVDADDAVCIREAGHTGFHEAIPIGDKWGTYPRRWVVMGELTHIEKLAALGVSEAAEKEVMW